MCNRRRWFAARLTYLAADALTLLNIIKAKQKLVDRGHTLGVTCVPKGSQVVGKLRFFCGGQLVCLYGTLQKAQCLVTQPYCISPLVNELLDLSAGTLVATMEVIVAEPSGSGLFGAVKL